ncbi:MAG: hypothetical protein ABI128_01525 [Rhodanobacter sp.]
MENPTAVQNTPSTAPDSAPVSAPVPRQGELLSQPALAAPRIPAHDDAVHPTAEFPRKEGMPGGDSHG